MDQLLYDSDDRVVINCDGACSNNGRPHASAGIGIFFAPNHPWNVSARARGRQTNNNAEIQAVEVAARIAKHEGLWRIRIITDSKFVIDAMINWIPEWRRNGWRNSRGCPVVNKEEFMDMMDALSGLDYVLEHVEGHNGHYGNVQADKLATNGAKAIWSCD